jgi:FkbM family methyltransferase
MKKALSFIIKILAKYVGRKNLENLLVFSAKTINVNLHAHGLLQIGASTGVHLENGSERFFLTNILTQLYPLGTNPVFFDVGANIGNYTLMVKDNFKDAVIYSFEPVTATYEQLVKNAGKYAKTYNIGLGDKPGRGILYNRTNSFTTEITTAYKGILEDVFKNTDDIVTIEFEIATVDSFCALKHINTIDFLKIDVEGNELSVLKGAACMISTNSIKLIQFEFNTHNTYSKVFLRDFYLLLPDFKFFRLNQESLTVLGDYVAINEIFTAQNIIAIHRSIPTNVYSKHCYSYD